MQDFLSSPHALVTAIFAGIAVLFLLWWGLQWRRAFRAWEGDTAAKLTAAGVPSWATDELVKGSQGDIAGALSSAKHAIAMFNSPAGIAELDTGVIMSAWANPTRRANLQKIWDDLTGGASAEQIKADVLSAVQGSPIGTISPLPTGQAALKDLVSGAVQHVQTAIMTAQATGESVLSHVADSLNAAGLGHLLPLVQVGTIAGAAMSKAAAATAAPAASALPSVTLDNAQPGHVVTVTATPGSPAAAGTAPAATN